MEKCYAYTTIFFEEFVIGMSVVTKSQAVELNKELIVFMGSWKSFLPGLTVLTHFDAKSNRIVLELIIVPVSHRRQGICGDVLDELTDIARLYEVEIWLQPADLFGVPKKVLGDVYGMYGFSWVDLEWMKKS